MAPAPRPSPTVEAIFAAYEADAEDGFRAHLGASEIGKECRRALWLSFRWAQSPTFSGRILRLFETGKREEERLIRNLRRIGVTMLDVDPETGRQWSVSAHGGHFGGSLDGVAKGIPEAPITWHVVEFKTHSIKSFIELKKNGVREAQASHFAQMQVYMHLTGLTRALYLAVCKDTDEIYSERVPVDPDFAEGLLAKAKAIIDASQPLARISEDPSWWQCGMCRHHALCHEGAAAERNCRTCLHSTPIDGGWQCERHGHMLSVAQQRQGCLQYLTIPDLVPGKVIDVGDDRVVYRLNDGTEWVDGVTPETPAMKAAPC
ncbi:MAG: oxidoreductase [Hyphomicrobiales bacterium]